MVKVLVFGLFLLAQFNLVAQDTITVNFDPSYQRMEDGGHGFMKLIANHSNTVSYDGEAYEITFPNQFFVSDTAIAFTYFTGWQNSMITNTTAFLMGNFTSSSPVVYVDYNHNLDFSDDGLPLKFDLDTTLVVYLRHSSVTGAYCPIELLHLQMEEDVKAEVESIFSVMGPDVEGNTIVSVDYWIADQRMNYKITDAWLNGQGITIGLYDYNCNGLYNDEGKDRILIGNADENVISGQLEDGAIVFSKSVQIDLASEIYRVVEIEATGKYLKLIKNESIYHKPLGIGDFIGDLAIELISGERTTLSEVQNGAPFLLLDFWGTWCVGCTQQLPDLKKIATDHAGKIQLLGLNYGDKVAAIDAYILKYAITWKNGIANQELLEKLRVDGFPNYLLLDSEGKIMLMNGTSEEITKLILN